MPSSEKTGLGPIKIIREKERQGKTVKGKILGLSGRYPSALQLNTEVAQFGHIVQPVLILFSFCLSR